VTTAAARAPGTQATAGCCVAAAGSAVDADLGEYAGWLDSERIVGNLPRAYADLGVGPASTCRLRSRTRSNTTTEPLPCLASRRAQIDHWGRPATTGINREMIGIASDLADLADDVDSELTRSLPPWLPG